MSRPNSDKPHAEQAHQMVAAGAVLLDVRTPAEFAAGHLDGSVNIPVQELAERIGELAPKKTAVVYCKAGVRAAAAEQMLRAAGFTDVLNILNMDGW